MDEVLGYFKANVLFKHFEVKGCADRVLIYLTLYTTQCLKRLETCATPADGLKALTAMAHESFTLPGARVRGPWGAVVDFCQREQSQCRAPSAEWPSRPSVCTGEANFSLGGFFPPPASDAEAGAHGWRRPQSTSVLAPEAAASASPAFLPPDLDCLPCSELCRGYLKQAREELGRRLVRLVYDDDGAPSKFWMVFAKRRFMNKQL